MECNESEILQFLNDYIKKEKGYQINNLNFHLKKPEKEQTKPKKPEKKNKHRNK